MQTLNSALDLQALISESCSLLGQGLYYRSVFKPGPCLKLYLSAPNLGAVFHNVGQ